MRQCDAELECEAVRAMLCQLYNRFCMRYVCSLTIALLTRLVQFLLLFFMFYKRAYQFVLQNCIFKIWKFFLQASDKLESVAVRVWITIRMPPDLLLQYVPLIQEFVAMSRKFQKHYNSGCGYNLPYQKLKTHFMIFFYF